MNRSTMNPVVKVLLLCLCLLIASCGLQGKYVKSIKKDMNIPYVFMPPSGYGMPYTVYAYTHDGNFQVVCQSMVITGWESNSPKDLKSVLDISPVASIDKSEIKTADFEVTMEGLNLEINELRALSPDINARAAISPDIKSLGDLSGAYKSKVNVTISLVNGTSYIPKNFTVEDAKNKIVKTPQCANSIAYLKSEMPKAEFYLASELYSYDVAYTIKREDGVDISTELSSQTINQIMLKGGYKSNLAGGISGQNLFVGFRGNPLEKVIGEIERNMK